MTDELLILEEDNCLPPLPCGVMSVSVFKDLLYKVAQDGGYSDTKENFMKSFAQALKGCQCESNSTNKPQIFFYDKYDDFPVVGKDNTLYVDKEKGKIYYWDNVKYIPIIEVTDESKMKLLVKDINPLIVEYVQTLKVEKFKN